VKYVPAWARGTILIRGSTVRGARVRVELRRESAIRRAGEHRPHARPVTVQRFSLRLRRAGAFTRRLKVEPGVYPGRYTVAISEIGAPPAGAARLPVRSLGLTISPPRQGVVQRAFIGRGVGGRAVQRFRRAPSIIFASFRFWTLPRRGQRTRVVWSFNGSPVGDVLRANFVGLLANNRLASRAGSLPRGRYRADLRVGRKLVARATTRVG
jgi:hypothetical protein